MNKTILCTAISTLCILLLFVCCGNNEDPRLILAERIIEENPDSAYSILSGINENDLCTDADNAKFGLLKTQALVKLDSTLIDDSAIKTSLAYYSKHAASSDYMKALFYSAWVQYCNGEYYGSMKNVSEAYDLASESKDSYWVAKCAELTSFLFVVDSNYAEAAKYSLIAAKQYKNAGKYLNQKWCIADCARSYVGMEKNDSAMMVLSQIPNPSDCHDSLVYIVSLDTEMYASFNQQRYVEADSIFELRLKYKNQYPVGSTPYHTKVLMLCNEGRTSEVPYYMHKGDSLVCDLIDSITMERAHIWYETSIGNYSKAIRLADAFYALRNKMYNGMDRSKVSLAQRDYFTRKAERKHIMAEQRKYLLYGGIGIAMMIGLSCFIAYRSKTKIKNLKLQNALSDLLLANEVCKSQMTDISNLTRTLDSRDLIIEELKQKSEQDDSLRDVRLSQCVYMEFSGYWKRITVGSRVLVDSDDGNNIELAMKNLRKELDELQSDKAYDKVENLVNEHCNNLMVKVRQELCFLNEKDLRLFCLIVSGIGPELVCVLSGLSRNSYGPLRSRLRKRIESRGSDNTQCYLDMI